MYQVIVNLRVTTVIALEYTYANLDANLRLFTEIIFEQCSSWCA